MKEGRHSINVCIVVYVWEFHTIKYINRALCRRVRESEHRNKLQHHKNTKWWSYANLWVDDETCTVFKSPYGTFWLTDNGTLVCLVPSYGPQRDVNTTRRQDYVFLIKLSADLCWKTYCKFLACKLWTKVFLQYRTFSFVWEISAAMWFPLLHIIIFSCEDLSIFIFRKGEFH